MKFHGDSGKQRAMFLEALTFRGVLGLFLQDPIGVVSPPKVLT